MGDYEPKEMEVLQELYKVQSEFADRLGECIAVSQEHIEKLERQKRRLIEVGNALTDPEMTLITFRERRQDFIDLVTKIE